MMRRRTMDFQEDINLREMGSFCVSFTSPLKTYVKRCCSMGKVYRLRLSEDELRLLRAMLIVNYRYDRKNLLADRRRIKSGLGECVTMAIEER